jgi:hypothetical protein
LLTGDYGWLYPNNKVSCKSQAGAYWDRIKNLPIQLPPVIDFEWTKYGGVAANPNYNDLDIWVTEFVRLSGIKPIMYSAAGYMNMFGAMPAALKAKFRAFWFANYGTAKPTLPLGFTWWDFWQFASSLEQKFYAPSSTGKLELDGIYWRGLLDELQQLAGGGTTPPPSGGTVDAYLKVTATSLNIRSTGRYDGTLNDLGDFQLIKDDVVHVVEMAIPAATYYRLDAIWRNGVRYDHPFTGMPTRVASATNQYWAASTDNKGAVWMVTTTKPVDDDPPTADSVHLTLDIEADVNGKKYGKTFENVELPPL